MLPLLKPEQVIKGLEGNGFRCVKQRGSHRKYKNDGKSAIVPMHYEVARGTLSSILEQAGLTNENLMKYI